LPSDRRNSRGLKLALATAILPAILVASGCGSDEEPSTDGSVEAPSASDFPAADGRSVEEIYASEMPSDDLVLAPTGQVFNEGTNRFGFGVFTAGREQITDAEVAIYTGPPNGPAKGPFPARIEDMETEAAFAAKTTTGDPDAAQVVYVADIELNKPGRTDVVAVVREGESFRSVRVAPSLDVDRFDSVPVAGDKAPVIDTPTADEVDDLSEIDTRDPHDTMHEENFADVVGDKPVVVTFATPLLCQSRVCGPVVDISEQVKSEYGDEVAFIHQEIFEDNDINKGLREQVKEYGLPTEPWVYVIDADGRVSTAMEGAYGVTELEDAVEKVAPS
jgi:hypothetical protein